MSDLPQCTGLSARAETSRSRSVALQLADRSGTLAHTSIGSRFPKPRRSAVGGRRRLASPRRSLRYRSRHQWLRPLELWSAWPNVDKRESFSKAVAEV